MTRTSKLTTFGLLAALASLSVVPAMAGPRSDQQKDKNNARNLAIGGAAVAAFGLFTHNNVATLLGAAGAALAGSQYEKDRKDQSQNNGRYYHYDGGNDFNRDGYNRDGFNRDGYNRDGFNRDGFNRDGYDRDGFNRNGDNRDGNNQYGDNRNSDRQYGNNQYGDRQYGDRQYESNRNGSDSSRNWNSRNRGLNRPSHVADNDFDNR